MKRRTILGGIVGGVLVGGYYNGVHERVLPPSDPMNQSLSGDFDRIEFSENGDAELYFDQGSSCSGFALLHRTQSVEDNTIMMCEAPEFTGPIEFNVISKIKQSKLNYPNNQFKAVGLEGGFSRCNSPNDLAFYGEKTSSTRFIVPDQLWKQSA